MSWQARASRTFSKGTTRHEPVVHGRGAVWLWHDKQTSARYDAATDRWHALADPFGSTSVRGGAVVASIGDDLVVWGGHVAADFNARTGKAASGGVRLGADGAWRAMATKRQPSARSATSHVWTGRELLVWGGWKAGKPRFDGAAYDPAADAWRKLATGDASEVEARACVWTGRELWVWGSGGERGRAHAYDPTGDAWRTIAPQPGEIARVDIPRGVVALADSALLVCRDDAMSSDLDACSAWRYEPRADLWEPCAPPPEVRGGAPQLVACGNRIVLALGERLFEYLVAKDAWGELPALAADSHLRVDRPAAVRARARRRYGVRARATRATGGGRGRGRARGRHGRTCADGTPRRRGGDRARDRRHGCRGRVRRRRGSPRRPDAAARRCDAGRRPRAPR